MKYHRIFGMKKPVIGMLHLKEDAAQSAVDRALKEVEIYQRHGVDAVIVENYFGSVQDCKAVLSALCKRPEILYGVNILGDDDCAFRLANEYRASFIQLDSVCGHLSPAQDAWFSKKLDRLRASFQGAVLGGVRFKYQPVRSGRTVEEDLRLGMERCDALVVTGEGTGMRTPQEKLLQFRQTVGDFPLLVGAGCTRERIYDTFANSDGAIVGSYFKEGHIASGDLNADYVQRFMAKKNLCYAVGRRLPVGELEQLDEFVYGKRGRDDSYLRHYERLPHGYQKAVGYGFAVAMAGMGGYISALHPLGHFDNRAGIGLPFHFLGWVRTAASGYIHETEAFMYGLDKACFCGQDPLLFYTDDGLGENTDWYPLIEKVSSGISDIRLVRLPQKRNFGQFFSQWILTFRLRRDACKEELWLNGNGVSTRQTGRYVACFPRSGEFDVALGQVVQEDLERLDVLAVDSFFFK